MFLLIALSIWTAMNAYVVWRAWGVAAVRRAVPLPLLISAVVLLASSYVAARILEALGWKRMGRILEWIGAEWLGIVMIALACFFIADLITGFGWLLREHVPAIRSLALIAAAVLSVVAALNALRPPVERRYEVAIANLPPERDGMVLVAISDLHLGTMTGVRWLEKRVAQVNALHPDMIVILGDLVEGDGEAQDEFTAALSRLQAPLGVWAIPGNHDRHGRDDIAVLLKRAGIRLLRDSNAEAAPRLIIAGVDMPGHQPVAGRGLVERALAGRAEGATILLSHAPEQVEKASRAGVGLMLSGHTHAGQIWPFGLFVRMRYRYLGGRYDVGGMPLIVCRGTGTWGPRMRLFRPNEILRIVLRRA